MCFGTARGSLSLLRFENLGLESRDCLCAVYKLDPQLTDCESDHSRSSISQKQILSDLCVRPSSVASPLSMLLGIPVVVSSLLLARLEVLTFLNALNESLFALIPTRTAGQDDQTCIQHALIANIQSCIERQR